MIKYACMPYTYIYILCAFIHCIRFHVFLIDLFPHILFSLTSSGTAISASQASPVLSGVETGSLDRGKAALERRNKKSVATGGSIIDDSCAKATGRVEVTRVNPDSLIDQLLRATNLDDHSADEENKHSKFNVYFILIIFCYCYCVVVVFIIITHQ